MEVCALLVCNNPESLAVLQRALAKLGISAEVCTGVSSAMSLLGKRKFDGIVVDCDDLDGGLELLKSLRSQPANKTVIIFAVVRDNTSMSQVFKMGANFVLEQPLAFDRVLRCFRAAHGLMVGERRSYYRHPIEIPVYLDFGGSTASVTVTSIDMSSRGMSVSSKADLAPQKEMQMRFTLPDSNDSVEGRGKVVWTDEGRAGIRFLKLEGVSKLALNEWLSGCFDYGERSGFRTNEPNMPY